MKRRTLAKKGRILGQWAGFSLFLTLLAPSNALGAPEDSVRITPTVRAVEKALPSVVNIATEKMVIRESVRERLFREFFDPYYQSQPESVYSVGSGVFIDEAGYLISNGHVVREADRIWVKNAASGDEAEARLIFEMPGVDLALLKVDPKEIEVTPVEFAPPGDLLLGEPVIALGNPYRLGGSVSQGILSAKNRRAFPVYNWLEPADWLQTDAAINPGNSGGPLINLEGKMIGVNVAIHGEAQNIGFAIPVPRIYEALSLMFNPEAVSGNWSGMITEVESSPPRVLAVAKDSPADKAGIRVGDEILQVEGRPTRTQFQMNRELMQIGADEPISVTVRTGARVVERELRLAGASSSELAKYVENWLGADAIPVDAEMAKRLGLRNARGFMIANVKNRGFAATNGLRERMVIDTVGRVELATLAHLAQRLHSLEASEKMEIGLRIPKITPNGQFLGWDSVTAETTIR